jgi:hypothetical protein
VARTRSARSQSSSPAETQASKAAKERRKKAERSRPLPYAKKLEIDEFFGKEVRFFMTVLWCELPSFPVRLRLSLLSFSRRSLISPKLARRVEMTPTGPGRLLRGMLAEVEAWSTWARMARSGSMSKRRYDSKIPVSSF